MKESSPPKVTNNECLCEENLQGHNASRFDFGFPSAGNILSTKIASSAFEAHNIPTPVFFNSTSSRHVGQYNQCLELTAGGKATL